MARLQLKPLAQQVMVITGATSGIGLVTARMAARKGARLVLAARDENELRELTDEINHQTPGRAVYVIADVGQLNDVQRIAETAHEHFGTIDTWVNNAAVSIYGTLLEIDLDEHRKLFETNYWGYVHGARVAVDEIAKHGGALINVGSVLSDRAIPEQGPYCASKHAAKAFTDALRMELEERDYAVSVTLIKPSAIDTPYKNHAKNYFDVQPQNPPPVYAPEPVAKSILHAAQYPTRDVYVGGAGKLISSIGMRLPWLTDFVMERFMSRLQKTGEPADPNQRDHHALYEPIEGGDERGGYPHSVHETSRYTQATRHPVRALLAAAGAGVALYTAWQSINRPRLPDSGATDRAEALPMRRREPTRPKTKV